MFVDILNIKEPGRIHDLPMGGNAIFFLWQAMFLLQVHTSLRQVLHTQNK